MKTIHSISVLVCILCARSLHAQDAAELPIEEHLDIGDVEHEGSVTFDGTTHKINGSGAEVYGTADSFFFAFREVKGDATITAHFTEGLQFVDPWAKAGVMIRGTTDPDSANIFLAVTSLNGLVIQSRHTKGAETTLKSTPGSYSTAAGGQGVWMRLQRAGDYVLATMSDDGVTWQEVANISGVELGEGALLGLAMSSHDPAQKFGFAHFESVSLVEGAPKD